MPRKHGPNAMRLIAEKTAHLLAPPGADVISRFTHKNIIKYTKEAREWFEDAMTLIKSCHDNPFGDDEEKIAAAILKRIEKSVYPRAV